MLQSETTNGRLENTYTYDSLGHVIRHDAYGALKATYGYHTTPGAAGAVEWWQDAGGRRTYALNWKRGTPQEVRRADGTSVYQTVDDNGWLTSSTDALGRVTSYQRDIMGRLTRYVPPKTQRAWLDTTVAYSFAPTATTQTIQRGNARTTVTYDNLWRPTLVKTEDVATGWASFLRSSYNYVAGGRQEFTSYPAATAAAATTGTTTTFDALGRTTRTEVPGAVTQYRYLNGHRREVVDPTNISTFTTFSGYGGPDSDVVVKVEQPEGITTEIQRNIWDEIEWVRQGGTNGGLTASETQYHYYDSQRRRCRYSTPQAGHTLFEYNAAGEMVAYQRGAAAGTGCTAPSGPARVQTTYDALGRPTLTNFADPATPDIARVYDANGNLLSATRTGAAWTYAYNELNLPVSETLVADGRTYGVGYDYGLDQVLTRRTLPGGHVITYQTDGLGRTAAVFRNGVTLASTASYHPNGQLAAMALANGHTFSRWLNPRQLTERVRVASPGVTALDQVFTYTAKDQVHIINDVADPTNTRQFFYDDVGRLELASSPAWGGAAYAYDPVGNLRAWVMGSRTYTTAMDAQGRLSQTWDTQAGNRALSYDGRGNVTTLGSLTFSYDHSDQPVATGGSAVGSYVYDGHLRRVRATSGGVTRYNVFDLSGRLVFVDTPSAGTSVAYVPGPEGTLARVDQAGVVSFQHADHLGSGASATNAAGAVLWRERYTPFGEKLLAPAANDNQASFTGHIDDAATGLTDMQARYYDPALGRFLSIDPVEFSAPRPDMFNRYAYAANDPVNMIDPDGEMVIPRNDDSKTIIVYPQSTADHVDARHSPDSPPAPDKTHFTQTLGVEKGRIMAMRTIEAAVAEGAVLDEGSRGTVYEGRVGNFWTNAGTRGEDTVRVATMPLEQLRDTVKIAEVTAELAAPETVAVVAALEAAYPQNQNPIRVEVVTTMYPISEQARKTGP